MTDIDTPATSPDDRAREIACDHVGCLTRPIKPKTNPKLHEDECDELTAAILAYGEERAGEEREACAKAAENALFGYTESDDRYAKGVRNTCFNIATAIRSRT